MVFWRSKKAATDVATIESGVGEKIYKKAFNFPKKKYITKWKVKQAEAPSGMMRVALCFLTKNSERKPPNSFASGN